MDFYFGPICTILASNRTIMRFFKQIQLSVDFGLNQKQYCILDGVPVPERIKSETREMIICNFLDNFTVK